MNIIKTIGLAFAMFSRIPMVRIDWNKGGMRYMLCAFPLVGLVIGLALWAWAGICGLFHIGTQMLAAGLTLIPVMITGGIHLDGFCDTVDALSSRASPERKREILKDPHTGAFAVISIVVYFLMYFGICTELCRDLGKYTTTLPLLVYMHMTTRTASGLSVIYFPSSRTKGLLDTFRESADRKRVAVVLLVMLALCFTGLLMTDWVTGAGMAAASLVCGIYLFFMSRRQFDGMSGDLAGYLLQLSELSMLAVLVMIQKVVLL